MAITITSDYKRDLNGVLSVQKFPSVLCTEDNLANLFRVQLTRGGVAESIPASASVFGYVVNGAGQTVILRGSVVDGKACVVLSSACYAIPGNAELAITVTEGETTTTVLVLELMIRRSRTDVLVDDTSVLPSIPELMALIEQAKEAAEKAKTFVGNAPKIENDVWFVFNTESSQYESTGVKAKGSAPVMTTTKSGKITTLYADGEPIGTIRDGSDGGGAGTITEVSINGQTVATSGVADITTVAVAEGSNGIPSAGAVYAAINAAVGNVESALAAL